MGKKSCIFRTNCSKLAVSSSLKNPQAAEEAFSPAVEQSVDKVFVSFVVDLCLFCHILRFFIFCHLFVWETYICVKTEMDMVKYASNG